MKINEHRFTVYEWNLLRSILYDFAIMNAETACIDKLAGRNILAIIFDQKDFLDPTQRERYEELKYNGV